MTSGLQRCVYFLWAWAMRRVAVWCALYECGGGLRRYEINSLNHQYDCYCWAPLSNKKARFVLLRGRVCFVLGQVWLLRWCAHEASEKTEEGHFESRAPTGWYFEVRQVCFLCAAAK